ncbi:MAG TPA: hypothetical protein PLI95_04665 [Polyangiaceae bacterium]|nr:hypothetical protein [Polyangiaceae bacterium]
MNAFHLGLLAMLLSGCGASGGSGAASGSNPDGCQVELLPVEEPSFVYENLGEVQMECHVDTGREACIARLKQNACVLGGDIAFNLQESSTGSQLIVSATIGKRSASAAPANPQKPTPTPPSSRAPSVPHPATALGFAFGAVEAATVKTCKTAGFEWQKTESGQFGCTGIPAEPTVKGSVRLRFCQDKLCSVEAIYQTPRATGEEWTRRFNLLKLDLQDRFGSASSSSYKIPNECMDEEIADCVTEGRARANMKWSWPSGDQVTLHLHAPSGKASAAVRLLFSKKAGQAR